MTYLLIKAVHVSAVLLWLGGMLMQAVQLQAERSNRTPWMPWELTMWRALQRRDRTVTVPAMGVAWVAGLYMAMFGAWLGSHWLSAKLVLVVMLSALHGMQAGRLRRQPAPEPSKMARLTMPGLLIMASAVVFLVITKPAL